MKMQYYLLVATLLSLPAAAQETYENARLTDHDLNGTARYVGMGGALEALGADISTIGSNPAGLGLNRHSSIFASGSLLMQSNGRNFANGSKTNASFDQIGFVYRPKMNGIPLNFGFNYSKGRNFNYVLSAAGNFEASNANTSSSQNSQSYIKALLGSGFEKNDPTYSQIDHLYRTSVLPDAKEGGRLYDYPASSFDMLRANTGYIANYDFSFSTNIDERVFLGLTFGMKDVHYDRTTSYKEALANNRGFIDVFDERCITGTGFDVTAGVIVRPIAESPFRLGAYVKSPTWYDLRTENATYLENGTTVGGSSKRAKAAEAYDFKIWTPWRFGFSLGHTVGNYLAFGLTYEYEDHSTINTRINDGVEVDYYTGSTYESTSPDVNMNNHTKNTLKGVSTLKIGAEYKPVKNLSLRAGYNYVSGKYNKDRQKDPTIFSPGTYYSSTTDFTNWDAINRFTLGVGYKVKHFSVDLAYQYSAQKGDFYPFSNMVGSVTMKDKKTQKDVEIPFSNTTGATKIENNQGQLLLTLGYTF